MKYSVKLSQRQYRRVDDLCLSHKRTNPRRSGFIEIEFRNIRRVEIHGDSPWRYRLRSSSRIFVLSSTCGIRSQIFRIEEKIRAFRAPGRLAREVSGRNSATGSPRRSITMTPPSEASRTNSDVWMWSSRTDVFLMCYIVAHFAAPISRGFRRHGGALGAPRGLVS